MGWKSLDLYDGPGDGTHRGRAESRDGGVGTLEFFAGTLPAHPRLHFQKAGFLDFGRGVHNVDFVREGLIGKEYIYTWERD
jgi:hypothetical protein